MAIHRLSLLRVGGGDCGLYRALTVVVFTRQKVLGAVLCLQGRLERTKIDEDKLVSVFVSTEGHSMRGTKVKVSTTGATSGERNES